MDDHYLDFESRLKGLPRDAWTTEVTKIAQQFGYATRLGNAHAAYHLKAGPKLLVTFESFKTIQNSRLAAEPRGFVYAREEGWSCLSIVSDDDSWFRDPAIFEFFDDQIDDGFFDEFDQVMFFGTEGGGYAASAYSVASPGAHVLAMRPQATLDPRITGFDRRHLAHRKYDFTSRYGFAPDMIDAARKAYVIFDPLIRFDACQAALFTKPNVSLLRASWLVNHLDKAFDALGLHDDMMLAVMDGQLTDLAFARMMRAKRAHVPYLRGLLSRAINGNHQFLAANLCRYVLRNHDDEFFIRKLEMLRNEGFTPSRNGGKDAAE